MVVMVIVIARVRARLMIMAITQWAAASGFRGSAAAMSASTAVWASFT